jgi:hypothetical protein
MAVYKNDYILFRTERAYSNETVREMLVRWEFNYILLYDAGINSL